MLPTNDIGPNDVYSTSTGYKQAIAKVYGAMALTGNTGGTGSADISGQIISDEGNSDFLRMFWYLQCLTTDEAGWTYHGNTDPLGIHQMTWSSVNQTIAGLYFRSFFQITLANEFISQAADANLAAAVLQAQVPILFASIKQKPFFTCLSILCVDGSVCKSSICYRK